MVTKNNLTYIGFITKPHGLYGECIAKLSININSLNIGKYDNFFVFIDINNCLVPFRVSSYRNKSLNNVFFHFDRVFNSKYVSKNLIGNSLFVSSNIVEDNLNFTDINSLLPGFNLYDHDNNLIGIIDNIDSSTINTIACVRLISNNKQVLIPVASELIISINTKLRSISINIPNGLI